MEYIRRYLTEFWNIYRHATITNRISIGDYRWKYRRIYFVGNILAGIFFVARRRL